MHTNKFFLITNFQLSTHLNSAITPYQSYVRPKLTTPEIMEVLFLYAISPILLPESGYKRMIRFFWIILIVFSSTMIVHADEFDFENEAFKKITVRHKAKRAQSNSRCYVYLEVSGNHDWRKMHDEINTVVDNNNCRYLTIYKIIKNINVRARKSNIDSDAFDYNLGVIIQNLGKLRNVDVTAILKDSKISTKGRSNIGVFFDGNKMNNVKVDTDVKIKDSQIGDNFFSDSDWQQ
jgi:hypothetical protein